MYRSEEHGVTCTTSVLEINCLSFHWHIARLPPNFVKRCWTMQANTMYNAKVGMGKHAISHPKFGLLINIVSKEVVAYRAIIGDILLCTCLDFSKMSSQSLERKGKWMYYKYFYYVFRFLCKVIYNNDKFIHASKDSYNEIMLLFEFGGVILGGCTLHYV